MSTQLSQPALLPEWKEELNRRLAAHKSRRGQPEAEMSEVSHPHIAKSSKAAQAAARVAARYAKAPSFSELQAAEARAAMRAAEEATRRALAAQAAAQEALFQWESAAAEEAAAVEEPVTHAVHAEPEMKRPEVPIARTPMEGLEIRWEPDMPPPPVAPPMAYARRGEATDAQEGPELWSSDAFEMEQALLPVEPPQAIPANLIEFPREMVATRRMRPRISGADPNATGELFGQLSIFEVDPTTVSTAAEAAVAAQSALASESAEQAAEWSGPEWQSIQLDAQPMRDAAGELAAQLEEPALEIAPMHQRMLAALVDVSLVVAMACGAAYLAGGHLHTMPALRAAELDAAGLVAGIGAFYAVAFLLLAGLTPGMWYARLQVRNFENEQPSLAQMRGRLLAMVASVMPMGMGMIWALFDDEGLSWHDRLSRTYLQAR
ncbi:MAG TPA: RDD family protein [Terracidiphilus sp.]|nr:RDD family protein [Terracidiphilus sp.]